MNNFFFYRFALQLISRKNLSYCFFWFNFSMHFTELFCLYKILKCTREILKFHCRATSGTHPEKINWGKQNSIVYLQLPEVGKFRKFFRSFLKFHLLLKNMASPKAVEMKLLKRLKFGLRNSTPILGNF